MNEVSRNAKHASEKENRNFSSNGKKKKKKGFQIRRKKAKTRKRSQEGKIKSESSGKKGMRGRASLTGSNFFRVRQPQGQASGKVQRKKFIVR